MSKNPIENIMGDAPEMSSGGGLSTRREIENSNKKARGDSGLVRADSSANLVSSENAQLRVMNYIKNRGPLPDVQPANPDQEKIFWATTDSAAGQSISDYMEIGASYAGKEHIAPQYHYLLSRENVNGEDGRIRAREMVLMVMPLVFYNEWMTTLHHKEPARMGIYNPSNENGLVRGNSAPMGYMGLATQENLGRLVARDDVLYMPNHAKHGVIEPVKKPKNYDHLLKKESEASDYFEKTMLNPDEY